MTKRTIEVFTAGCACCDEAVAAVRAAACRSCDVQVLDMKDATVAARARQLGIHRVPAVAIASPGSAGARSTPAGSAESIDGQLADCCATGAVDIEVLRGMGLGAG